MARTRVRIFARAAACLLAAAAGVAGCSKSQVGLVDGVVKLDGKPLSEATVMFQPDNGRTSVGETDASGHFSLRFNRDEPGAVIGRHTVSVETYRIRVDDQGNPVETKETVPAKFNRESELVREVVAGKQTLNFDLESR